MYKFFFKSLIDRFLSFVLLVCLFPIFIIISLIIIFVDGHHFLYMQKRIGKGFKKFNLIKFRTMRTVNRKILLSRYQDKRITRFGYFLRKCKIDELPQLINVLKGDMSLVGPRPEVEKLLEYFNSKTQKIIKNLKPGITDYSSIYFSSEEKFYKNSKDIYKTYKNQIVPVKEKLIVKYYKDLSFFTDIKIIFLTIKKLYK